MKSKSLLVLAASGLLVLSACGKQPQPEPQPVDPTPVDPQPVDPQPAAAEPANGVFDYTNVSNAEKTQILGTLEKYAVDNKLTGLPVVENGGYVMYNPTIRKGAPRYIKGYGFGILTEGELTGDLEGETDARYKRYYHTFESDDPSTNYNEAIAAYQKLGSPKDFKIVGVKTFQDAVDYLKAYGEAYD